MIALALIVLLTVTGAVTVFLAAILILTAPFIKLGGRRRPDVEGAVVAGNAGTGTGNAGAGTGNAGTGTGAGTGNAGTGTGNAGTGTGNAGTGAGNTGLLTLCLDATLLVALGFRGHVVLFVPADLHREQAPPYWLMVTLSLCDTSRIYI